MSDRVLEELAALRRELAEVREKLTYREQVFIGWKAIAEYLGYSEDHAKALGQDPVDPIPYRHKGGFVEAERTMLDRWAYRRTTPAQKKGARGPGQAGGAEGSRKQLDGPAEPKRGRAKDGSAS